MISVISLLRLKLVAAFILYCSSSLFAQYKVEGSIVDEKGKPVEIGNVILLNPGDSVLVTGDMFMDGKFTFGNATQDKYILKITALSYNDHYQLIDNSMHQPVVNAGTIKMKSNQLKEVEVVVKMPLLTNEGDRMKVNVENSLLSQSGTALDVLEGSPGLLVNSDGAVTVFGKGAAVIYIDGVLANADLLRSIPSNQVKQVEIITKPSAMYDAQGRVVINVITKKVVLNGYQAELFTQQTYAKKYYSFAGGSFSYRKNKFSLLARYSYFGGNRWSMNHYERAFVTGNDSVTMANDVEEWRKIKGANYYGAGLRYSIDSVSSLGVNLSGSYAMANKETFNTNAIRIGESSSELSTVTEGNTKTLDDNINMNYNRKLDTLGSEFTAQASYSKYKVRSVSDIDEDVTDTSGTYSSVKKNIGINDINIVTGQVDYAHVFTNKWKVETGLKFSGIFNNSSVTFERLTSSGEWIGDETVNNGFDYNEQVSAVYAQLGRSKGKWMYRAGVRGELTNTDGFSKQADTSVGDTTYFNVFPSAFAEYSFSDKLKINFDYSYRINRPKYQDMDPFINYLDSLSSIRGNPYLHSEYTHEITTSLVYLDAASIELGYSYTKDAINMYIEKVGTNSNQFYGQSRNLKRQEGYNIGLVLPYQNKWYTMYNAVGWAMNSATYKDAEAFVMNEASSWYAYSYHKFNVKDITLDVLFNYASGGADGIFIGGPFYSLRGSIQYMLLDKKLTLRFIANDILKSSKETGEANLPGFILRSKEVSDSHFFRFAVSYRFGKLSQKAMEEGSINNEERSRIK